MKRNETDTSTAPESVEDTEDNDSEVSGQTYHISSTSRSSNISKGRGSQKRSPTWNFFIPMADHVQYQHNCYNGNEEKCNWQNGGRDTTNIRLHLSNYHPQQFEELQSEKNKTC